MPLSLSFVDSISSHSVYGSQTKLSTSFPSSPDPQPTIPRSWFGEVLPHFFPSCPHCFPRSPPPPFPPTPRSPESSAPAAGGAPSTTSSTSTASAVPVRPRLSHAQRREVPPAPKQPRCARGGPGADKRGVRAGGISRARAGPALAGTAPEPRPGRPTPPSFLPSSPGGGCWGQGEHWALRVCPDTSESQRCAPRSAERCLKAGAAGRGHTLFQGPAVGGPPTNRLSAIGRTVGSPHPQKEGRGPPQAIYHSENWRNATGSSPKWGHLILP